jgi:hypothetical protein
MMPTICVHVDNVINLTPGVYGGNLGCGGLNGGFGHDGGCGGMDGMGGRGPGGGDMNSGLSMPIIT